MLVRFGGHLAVSRVGPTNICPLVLGHWGVQLTPTCLFEFPEGRSRQGIELDNLRLLVASAAGGLWS
jgi:hypothetical protein